MPGVAIVALVLGAVVLVVLWDQHRQRAKPAPRPKWKDLCRGKYLRIPSKEGRDDLWFRLTNATDQPLELPVMTLSLGYTSYPGGLPGVGGNGLGGIFLKRDMAEGRVLAPGESITVPLDTAEAPIRPEALRVGPLRYERVSDAEAEKTRQAIQHNQDTVAQAARDAPCLAALLTEDSPYFLDIRLAHQHPGWTLSPEQLGNL